MQSKTFAQKNTMSIKSDLQVKERPREKLIHNYTESVSDSELLAILIGSGNKQHSALDIAKDMLQRNDYCFHTLSRLSAEDLLQIQGLGPARAAVILAAFEVGRRKRASVRKIGRNISCSNHAYEALLPHLGDIVHEEMWILCLSRNNKLVRAVKVSEGGFSGTVVDPKKIFLVALQNKASSIIIAHNHPSGNLDPSEEDKKITEKLVHCGRIMELPVLDHVIVTENGYYSFADEGKLG